jgi:hypothetical protein
MPFVIEKDMGEGNPPAFLTNNPDADDKTFGWSTLENAFNFISESTAQSIIDKYPDVLGGCIVMPNDETIFTSPEKKP